MASSSVDGTQGHPLSCTHIKTKNKTEILEISSWERLLLERQAVLSFATFPLLGFHAVVDHRNPVVSSGLQHFPALSSFPYP